MARNKNKGFSLIEIIIAIAILTLLLTPVIKQLAYSMELNRKSKLQQYANEEAEYVLEYFKAQPMADLNSLSFLPDDADFKCTEFESHDKTCAIYLLDTTSNTISAAPVGSLFQYKTYKYILSQVKLGSKNEPYDRIVLMDDLDKVVANITAPNLPDGTSQVYTPIRKDDGYDIESLDGFTYDEDGRLVKYNEGELFPMSIVCIVEAGSTKANPNTVDMGNMYDLDINNMAVVNGETVTYDTIATNDFYNETMSILKGSTNKAMQVLWEDEMNAATPGTYLTTDYYLDGMTKLTEVRVEDTVTGTVGDVTEGSYKITFIVRYENKVMKGYAAEKTVSKEYVIKTLNYDYKFDTSLGQSKPKCPDIYFEYQPFAVKIADGDIETLYYSSNDLGDSEYILMNSNVEDVKLYLYKPKWDQATVFQNDAEALFATTDIDGDGIDETVYTAAAHDVDMRDSYYVMNTKTGTGTNLVDIVLLNKTGSEQVTVYTNLKFDLGRVVGNMPNSQFVLSDSLGALNTYFVGADGSKINASNFDSACLKTIEQDKQSAEKLYSLRVSLIPEDATLNTVTLTGAKGVD